MSNAPFSRELAEQVITALEGWPKIPRTIAMEAYAAWQAGRRIPDCRYGKEAPIAVDCDCRGHRFAMCYWYFDQVKKESEPGGKIWLANLTQ